jgi:polyisoprenoid-binding protein YceI
MIRRPSLLGLGLFCSFALAALTTAASARAESYTVDSVHSSVLFRIKHMNTSNAWGRFNDIQGTADLDGAKPALNVTLKVDSIDTANQKRDEHLEGPDFFSAKQFPTIEFKSTKVTKVDDTHYDVEGTLTLHGVNKPISVKLEKTGSGRTPMTGPIVGYATEFKIKRSDYGMKLMIGPLGDDVLLIVALECAAK